MRYYRFIIGLVFLLTIVISCEKNNFQKLDYKYELYSSNLDENVSCVYFVDNETGYAANWGKVFKTIDNGISWQSDSITNLPLNSIYFINKDLGFIVGGQSGCGGTGCTVPGSIVYKTSNGGQSWIKQTIPYRSSELNSVYFINENIGFAIGLGLHIKTTDGGEIWEQLEFEYEGLMKKILFIDSLTGYAVGLNGNIFKTTDQGNNWIKTNNDSDGHIYDFCFANENIGYAGGQKEIVKTVDGGDNWNILTNSPSEIYFIHFTNENNGIAIGKGHYTGGDWGIWTNAIFSTSNGGKTWEIEDDINFGSIVSFPSSNMGYSIVANSTYKITIE